MATYRVKVGESEYQVQVQDVTAHPVIVTIGDQQYEIWIEEEEGPDVHEIRPAAMTTTSITTPIHSPPDPHSVAAQPRRQVAGGKTVRAPMPGQIIKIAVAPGDQVERGELVCVLEAMKMNNQIRAPQPGTIAEVQTEVGAQVNYGDPLIRFE